MALQRQGLGFNFAAQLLCANPLCWLSSGEYGLIAIETVESVWTGETIEPAPVRQQRLGQDS